MEVYSDNGRAFGNRTRVFRECEHGGLEWMYGVDYASGDDRWYCFYPADSIAQAKAQGMFLSRIESGPAAA